MSILGGGDRGERLSLLRAWALRTLAGAGLPNIVQRLAGCRLVSVLPWVGVLSAGHGRLRGRHTRRPVCPRWLVRHRSDGALSPPGLL